MELPFYSLTFSGSDHSHKKRKVFPFLMTVGWQCNTTYFSSSDWSILDFLLMTSPMCSCYLPRKCRPVNYKKSQKAGFPIVTWTPLDFPEHREWRHGIDFWEKGALAPKSNKNTRGCTCKRFPEHREWRHGIDFWEKGALAPKSNKNTRGCTCKRMLLALVQ